MVKHENKLEQEMFNYEKEIARYAYHTHGALVGKIMLFTNQLIDLAYDIYLNSDMTYNYLCGLYDRIWGWSITMERKYNKEKKNER